MTNLKEDTLLELKDYNFQRNLLELKNTLDNEEIFEDYFESVNYSAEIERKSPISGGNSFGYLFVDEWIWNTIFVLSNKKLYLINTKENYEKVSINEITFDKIEYLNLYLNDSNEPLLELKLYDEPKIQYKPRSCNYLDILRKFDKLKIIENKEAPNMTTKNNMSTIIICSIFIIILIALILIYIFI